MKIMIRFEKKGEHFAHYDEHVVVETLETLEAFTGKERETYELNGSKISKEDWVAVNHAIDLAFENNSDALADLVNRKIVVAGEVYDL